MRISVPGGDLGRYPRVGTRRYAPRESKTYLRSKLTRFMPPGGEACAGPQRFVLAIAFASASQVKNRANPPGRSRIRLHHLARGEAKG